MDIKKILISGESETVEFKESFDRETIETVVASSNTRGGVIVVGVSDKADVKGVAIGKETLNGWANQVSQNTEPTIIPEINVAELDGKTIAFINVREFPLKPVATRGRCFRRVGNSNRRMSPQEIAQMHLSATGSSWDALPAKDATIDDIDFEKVNGYIKKAVSTGRRKIGDDECLVKVLEKMELIKNSQPTLAAVILFGKVPQEKLLQATVHCGRFKQETIIIDDKLIGGTAIEQIEEVMDFIRKNTNVRFVMTGRPAREEVWDYPLESLREAVVNAVCHRDYADNSDIQLKIHDNRLTIWNPGGLPPGMTIEELYNPNHSSKLRNKLIGQIFYDVGLIERYGSGIQKIIDACKKAGLPTPVFEEKFGGFLVIFNKDIYTEEYLVKLGLNERQIKAALYVKEKGRITNKEYQELVNTTKKTASRDLVDLVEKDVFDQVGTTGKGTYYLLKETKGT
ncbi:helix-turn-helix domain-containing protein [Candidatus Oleimmundimicrobium sp.]|uniref:helix-turn-helix domain-containing protein n=1 Tax=Candidatus Oleimmundimicrobium sp. TaxID=3060597 RepID=UPI0027229337|nr:helix-turn-helix domain-containing protein [Candidatus Oleimmundimicrobium sp.]MDO8886080.1 helix-turn-helix domain-containing protein [Candidatus Oleimmundimicrobium sp.]